MTVIMAILVNTRRSPNVGLMLAQRLRRWPNISLTLGERLVFTGMQMQFNRVLTPGITVIRWVSGTLSSN